MQVGAAHAATQEAYSWIRKGSCTADIGTEHNRSSSQILQSSPVERTSCSIIVELCPILDLHNSRYVVDEGWPKVRV